MMRSQISFKRTMVGVCGKKRSNTGRELTAAKWCIHGGSVVLLYMSEIPIFFNSSTIKQNKINATPRSALALNLEPEPELELEKVVAIAAQTCLTKPAVTTG